MDNNLLWGAILCIVRCVAVSLTSTPLDASRTSQCDNQKCLHILSDIPREQSHPWLRTAGIENEGGAIFGSVIKEERPLIRWHLNRVLNKVK